MNMSNLPRRTIEELKTRYFCEPEIYDVYVEGRFDDEIIKAWCKKKCEENIVPYEIDTVDVPFEVLSKYKLTEGNKQRVIALAKELSLEDLNGYRCLVDKDLDHWLNGIDDTKNLIWTEYCSLELYYFKEELIKQIVIDIANSKVSNWDVFFESFIQVLKQLYCLRLSDARLDFNMTWIELDKYISCNGSSLSFDIKLYLKRNVINNRLSQRLKDFESEYNSWMDKLVGDPRLYVRGHDFVKLISLANKNFKGVKTYHEEITIERLFFAFIDDVQELIDSVIKSL